MHPLIWNLTRFHPFWALMEMTMGIAAARHVMLDTEEEKKKKKMRLEPSVFNQFSTCSRPFGAFERLFRAA